MSIYNFDINQAASDLMPPALRKPKHIAWLKVILKPFTYMYDLFKDYKDGGGYPPYVGGFYQPGNRIVYTDGQVYEAIATSIGIPPTDSAYWVKYLGNFIGANERVNYNAQYSVFTYALNKWFQIAAADPKIYITTNATSSHFMMGQTSAFSSTMASNSIFQTYFMGNVYTPTQFDFTIYFPIATYNALPGGTNANKTKIIQTFVNKYKIAGTNYNIITY